METLVLTIHILIALALIGSVLLQRSEGGGFRRHLRRRRAGRGCPRLVELHPPATDALNALK